jgi:EAL domain-containing protein (putative c-di-GMP-specific phosphodiesterase class I)
MEISIDDFGTGYSSMSYRSGSTSLPENDRSFIGQVIDIHQLHHQRDHHRDGPQAGAGRR